MNKPLYLFCNSLKNNKGDAFWYVARDHHVVASKKVIIKKELNKKENIDLNYNQKRKKGKSQTFNLCSCFLDLKITDEAVQRQFRRLLDLFPEKKKKELLM